MSDLAHSADTGRICWHCEQRPAADNDLLVCEVCWQEWQTHRRYVPPPNDSLGTP
jgi:hypothetical protein